MPVQVPASQQTPPPQLVGTPVQRTSHELPEQLTRPAHARAPEQSIAQVSPVHAIGAVQLSAAGQPTLHSLPPQVIPSVHEPAPMQSILHALEALQSMVDVHEPAPVHVTVHGIPGGQTMGPVHVPAAVHVTAQVPPGSHVPTPASAQIDGHTAAASIETTSAAASLASAVGT